MKLLICTKRDKDYEWYIQQAHACGYDVYVDEERGEFFVKIGGDRVYRAPDAVFEHVPSGLYTFDKEGNPQRVDESLLKMTG